MLCTTAINTSNTITRGRPGLVNTDCAAEITDGKKTGYSQKWTANRSENASARSSTYARIHRRTSRKHNAPGRICRMGAEIIPIQSNSSMHRYSRAALCKDISLQRGRSCARSLASCIPRSSEDRSSGMFFIQVVRGRPGGRLQFSTGSPKKLLEEYKYDRLGVYSCHICGQMRCIPWLQNSPPQPSSHVHCHGWSHLPY